MKFYNYQTNLKTKILNGEILTEQDKGITADGYVINDYPILAKYNSNGDKDPNLIDLNGNLDDLYAKKRELENKFLQATYKIEYIPMRIQFYQKIITEIEKEYNFITEKQAGIKKFEELKTLFNQNKIKELKEISKKMMIEGYKKRKEFLKTIQDKKEITLKNEEKEIQGIRDIFGEMIKS